MATKKKTTPKADKSKKPRPKKLEPDVENENATAVDDSQGRPFRRPANPVSDE